uniref:Uncharacterized protein n=1 Tax=Acrobeloides nanus TaxID=290746 RepID=A0A914DAI4_9BILA
MSNHHCCCGCIHVRLGANIIAVLTLLPIIVVIVSFILQGRWVECGGFIAGEIVLIIICSLIFVADKKENYLFYLPYLIVKGIAIALILAVSIFLWAMGSSTPEFYKQNKSKEEVQVWTFSVAGFLLLIALFYIWWWSVVYKAYKYMQNVVKPTRIIVNA